MSTNWYPLLFEPILQDRIWGGQKLKTVLQKNILTETTGESWEISSVQNNISVVTNGLFSNQSLDDLIEKYPVEILGTDIYKKFGKQFPLLIKFLDAKEDLSIQLHPNDDLAKKRHNSFGKTEMWYVVQAEPGARIIAGFKQKSSPDEYLHHLKNKTLLDVLQQIEVKTGDVFFLETGTIHAIGAGIVIAEIQQTSDITYRIFDWDRKDANGNERELHTALALQAINYNFVDTKRQYKEITNEPNNIVDCPFFTTNFINLNGEMNYLENKNHFKILMCIEGAFELKVGLDIYNFTKGQTTLVPAALKDFHISGKATILEIYIS